MMTRSTLTPLAVENLRRAAMAEIHRAGIISRSQADRPSLAALHARGLLSRTARREGRNAADNSYTYRLTQAGLDALRAELAKGSSR